jgi:hypothetical protein
MTLPPKSERYFSGMPVQQDPRRPLPEEGGAGERERFVRIVAAVLLFGLGAVLGLSLAPQTPGEAAAEIAALQEKVRELRGRNDELSRTVTYTEQRRHATVGVLAAADRARHEQQGDAYASRLRQVNAQAASQLVRWFIGRWNDLLDKPAPDQRIKARAELLGQFIGAMAANIDPADYIAWQSEFLTGTWLGELHFDMDGDGFPASRTARSPRDAFVNVSVCHIAMALNLTMVDVQFLVMPGMRCDSPKAQVSMFLQSETLADAADEFVQQAGREGFLVKERENRGVRMVLVGRGR